MTEPFTATSIDELTGSFLGGSSLGRRPGLFFCTVVLCLVARIAAAADPRVVTIVETHAPITLDGSLNEEVWQSAEAATDFVQAEPHEGEAATERTEVRLLYDRGALYVPVPLPSEL